MKRILPLLLTLLLALSLAACAYLPAEDPLLPPSGTEQGTQTDTPNAPDQPESPNQPQLAEDGSYTSRDDVALYLHLYGRLPDNFITKDEARRLGWEGGSLEPYAPGCCIGGSRFGNYEGLLPDQEGRSWQECDIDTLGASSRGARRLVYSNDGLIYYTDDHYESFQLLYDGWD